MARVRAWCLLVAVAHLLDGDSTQGRLQVGRLCDPLVGDISFLRLPTQRVACSTSSFWEVFFGGKKKNKTLREASSLKLLGLRPCPCIMCFIGFTFSCSKIWALNTVSNCLPFGRKHWVTLWIARLKSHLLQKITPWHNRGTCSWSCFFLFFFLSFIFVSCIINHFDISVMVLVPHSYSHGQSTN